MSEAIQLRGDGSDLMVPGDAAPVTALAGLLAGDAGLIEARGAQTVSVFSDAASELWALINAAGVFDSGARVRLRITGEDRVRWLNGMVTNTVKALAPGAHNYNFVLNAQGRIQGDATVFALADELVLETDRAQAERIFAHLDRFIIMDDVELAWIPGQTTLGLAGPDAEAVLGALDLPVPAPGCVCLVPGGGNEVVAVVRDDDPELPRFSLWVAEAAVASAWERLIAAGARATGALAVDALRVLEGTPVYGIDMTDKTLAQETGQLRALNFQKGCYLGQEIVERVRSRANVHRGIRQFSLHGGPASAGAPLTADGIAVGEVTSVTEIAMPGYSSGQVGLGLVRTEALGQSLAYPGGSAAVLSGSPLRSAGKKNS